MNSLLKCSIIDRNNDPSRNDLITIKPDHIVSCNPNETHDHMHAKIINQGDKTSGININWYNI